MRVCPYPRSRSSLWNLRLTKTARPPGLRSTRKREIVFREREREKETGTETECVWIGGRQKVVTDFRSRGHMHGDLVHLDCTHRVEHEWMVYTWGQRWPKQKVNSSNQRVRDTALYLRRHIKRTSYSKDRSMERKTMCWDKKANERLPYTGGSKQSKASKGWLV